jgi:hypothetical protein
VPYGRKNLLFNEWEQRTDDALAEAADRCGVRVLLKVRVASALPIDRSGLTDEQFGYALRSEFDFVIADGDSGTPQFAVEFDEHHHLTDPKTIHRDRLKAQVCDHFDFPLVRIDSAYLRRERRFTLIGYLVEAWDLERAFYEAQERGTVPYDEPFIIENFLSDSLGGAIDWPYWLDHPARLDMVAAYRAGKLRSQTPEEIVTPYPDVGSPDDAEFVESWAVLELASGGYVMGQARLRNFKVFIAGVTPRSLASSVAVGDAGRQLSLVLAGEQPAYGAEDLRALRGRTKGWQHQGGHVTDPHAESD